MRRNLDATRVASAGGGDDDGSAWGGTGLPLYEEVPPTSRVAVCVVSSDRELPGMCPRV